MIDGRGAPARAASISPGLQKFLGHGTATSRGRHGLDAPVLMDATVAQRGGYRFVYVLPLAPRRLLVEDTYYSDAPDLDRASCASSDRAPTRRPAAGRRRASSARRRACCRSCSTATSARFWAEAPGVPCPAPACGPGSFTPPPATRCPTRCGLADRIAAHAARSTSAPVAARSCASIARGAGGASSASSGCSTACCSGGGAGGALPHAAALLPAARALINRFYAGRPTSPRSRRVLLSGRPCRSCGPCGLARRRGRARPRATAVARRRTHERAARRRSSARASAAWPSPSGCSPPACARLFEKRDKPGGRAYVYEDQGFTFDAGPTVITAPDCLRNCSRWPAGAWPTTSRCCRSIPFYRLFWEDGFTLRLLERPRESRRADQRARARRTSTATGASSPTPRRSSSRATRSSPTCRSSTGGAWCAWRRSSCACRRYRTVYSVVSHFIEDPHLRQAFSFHSLSSAATRSRPRRSTRSSTSWSASWGVYFPRGGTGALVRGAGRALRGAGRRAAARQRGGRDPHANGPRDAACAATDGWRARLRRSWRATPTWCTPTSKLLRGTSRAPRRAAGAAAAACATACRCSSSTSARGAGTRSWPTTT